jgi:hypothetical protein
MTTPSHPDTPSWHDHDPSRDDRLPEAHQDFWGDADDWASELQEPRVSRQRLGATVSRWWNSTGSLPVTRTHGTPTRQQPVIADDDTDRLPTDDWSTDDRSTDDWPTDDRPIDDRPIDDRPAAVSRSADRSRDDAIMDDWSVEDWSTDQGLPGRRNDDHHMPPAPPRLGVDPLLARLGGLAIVLTLLVPLVVGFSSGDGDALRTSPSAASAPPATPPTIVPLPSASTAATDTVSAATNTAGAAGSSVAPTSSPTADTTASSDVAPVAASASDTGPAADAQALATDPCALEYEVVAGDFWIRIADGSGVALADVLAANSATVATPLYPGRTVCLPEGAATPPPPPAPASTIVVPPTAERPPTGSSRPASTVPTTTRPPATPTTTAPPPRPPASNASAAEVQAIIRAIWPDDLEERALQVAWRESNYVPTAKNFCCYGVFQIYWSVHKGWLAGIGITSAEQLYDPTLNTRAALALYERSGGWGPWGG